MDLNLNLTLGGDESSIYVYYPPPSDISTKGFVVISYLMIALAIGIGGNTSELVWQQYSKRLYTPKRPFSPNLLLLNIKFICLAQLLIVITLPSVIVDYILDFWIFNNAVCTSHFIFLNFGRTASAWLLVLCYFNQILQDKTFRITEKRKSTINKCFYFVILFVGSLLLVPTLTHIQLTEELIMTDFEKNTEIRTRKCLMSFNNSHNRFLVNTFTFGVDFILPILSTIGLAVYLRHYKQTNQPMSPSDSRIQHLLIISTVVFVLSNGPHWFAVSLVLFADIAKQTFNFELHGESAGFIADFALICVYIQPAVMWISLGKISKILITNLGSQDHLDMTRNSTSVLPISRSRVFSNISSECHSLPDNISGTNGNGKDPLKPCLSLNPLDSEKLANKKVAKTNIRKPNFREIKLSNRVTRQERMLRLDTAN